MSSTKKTYFLAPNWDYPPDGLIRLGSLITDPKKPHRSLNRGSQVTIDEPNIVRSVKKEWELTRAQLTEVRVGVWGTFLLLVGVKAGAGYNRKHDSSDIYKCDALETNCFQPDNTYIFESLQNQFVKSYIIDNGHRLPVYMITGVKIAKGFSATTKSSRTQGGDVKLGVNTASLEVPAQAGPAFKISVLNSEATSFGASEGSTDCVFAYQLIKIRSRRNDKFTEEEFYKGALLNTDDKEEEPHMANGLDEDWEIEEVWMDFPYPNEQSSSAEKKTMCLAVDEHDAEACIVVATG